jgi:hypothetical protein
VFDSARNDKGGAPTLPEIKERELPPAAIVEALRRFTESHKRITCWLLGTETVAAPDAPVVNEIDEDAWFVM